MPNLPFLKVIPLINFLLHGAISPLVFFLPIYAADLLEIFLSNLPYFYNLKVGSTFYITLQTLCNFCISLMI